jgi:hypothetical protein
VIPSKNELRLYALRKHKVTTYPVNRWRAAWLNKEGTIARRRKRDEDIVTIKATAEEKKRSKRKESNFF